jgi:Golgi apparatus protein 1
MLQVKTEIGKSEMNRLVLFTAALLLTPLPALSQQQQQQTPAPQTQRAQSNATPSGSMENRSGAPEYGQRTEDLLDRIAQSGLRDRLESAIERVEDACGDDIEEYCGDITPGGGRIAACMHAHADALSRRCRFSLFRTARNIRSAVENIADECWSNIQAQCGSEQNVGECARQKSASLSPTCQTVVAVLHDVKQKIGQLRDMPVYSADNKDLGRVVEAVRGPDGKLQAIQIQVGRFLGLGDKVVKIPADQIHEMADRIMLQLNSDQVRNLPESKK